MEKKKEIEEEKVTKKKVKEEVGETDSKKKVKKADVIITSRVLFISVLDKIYLILLGIYFFLGTFTIFARGDITSLSYGFFRRVVAEVIFLAILFILYLFFNWLYKCAVKTILCLTKNEVYKESYIPFRRVETSIPLDKISKVDAINLFWIFRVIVIHQFNRMPLIFFTWNNQEFKDELCTLITTQKEHVQNEYENKDIITKDMYKYLKFIGLGLALIIVLIGFVRFFTYTFSMERRIAGTYTYENKTIVLNGNGSCHLEGIRDRIESCEWYYDKDDENVVLSYEYKYYSYYDYTGSGTLKLQYDKDNKTLKDNYNTYKKR